MPLREQEPGIWVGTMDICRGELRQVWRDFGAQMIICHLTDHHDDYDTIDPLLADGIRSAAGNFPGIPISFVVCDSTYDAASLDSSIMDVAVASAKEALRTLYASACPNVQVVVVPHEGYDGNCVPGRGSALRMIYEEMEQSLVRQLLVLSGGTRNPMGWWQEAFGRLTLQHPYDYPGRPYIVYPRYTRHFLDDALARFTVGPLSTLLGRHVAWCDGADFAMPETSVVFEREVPWNEARLRHTSAVHTALDAAADPVTVIYQLYLGTRDHRVEDRAAMAPAEQEVIAAALERLLHYETQAGVVTRMLAPGSELSPLVTWGPDRTGIAFADPGPAALDLDVKMALLLERWDDHRDAIRQVQGEETLAWLQQQREALASLVQAGDGPLTFLGVDRQQWTGMLSKAVAHLLAHQSVEAPARCLAYLHVAAFYEHVRRCLLRLGLETVGAVREAQGALGPSPEQARAYYQEYEEAEVATLVGGFFQQRGAITRLLDQVPGPR